MTEPNKIAMEVAYKIMVILNCPWNLYTERSIAEIVDLAVKRYITENNMERLIPESQEVQPK